MPIENHRVQIFGLFFVETRAGERQELRREPLALPIPDQTNPLLERFPDVAHI